MRQLFPAMYIKQNPPTQHIFKKYYDSNYDLLIISLVEGKGGKIKIVA